MVQTIKRNTYRCYLCKVIHTSLKSALECEEHCLDSRDNFVTVTKYGYFKAKGEKKVPVMIPSRIRKSLFLFQGEKE